MRNNLDMTYEAVTSKQTPCGHHHKTEAAAQACLAARQNFLREPIVVAGRRILTAEWIGGKVRPVAASLEVRR